MTSKIDTEGYVQTEKKIKDKINHWKMLKEIIHFLHRKKKTTIILYSLETIQARSKLDGISRRL